MKSNLAVGHSFKAMDSFKQHAGLRGGGSATPNSLLSVGTAVLDIVTKEAHLLECDIQSVFSIQNNVRLCEPDALLDYEVTTSGVTVT
jgi:hypothetical protein